jgi:multidrug resistance efflux pump
MKRRVLVAVIALVVIAGGAGWWIAKGRVPRKVVLSGTIEARDAQVGSLVGGRVQAVHVDEGAVVKKGDLLVTLEPDLLDRQIREQQARVENARASLTKAVNGPRREETEKARADWQNAERESRRQAALFREGLASQQQRDNAATAAATSKQAYDELARGNRPEDIASARAALLEQESQLEYQRRQREELAVRSPADGVIQTMDLRPGDLVAANQGIVTVLEPSEIWVRVYVPEPQLGLVRVNERVSVSVDTYPGRAFPGKIVEIRPQSEYTPRNIQTLEERGDQVFGVKVAIEPAPELKPGMAATVRLAP